MVLGLCRELCRAVLGLCREMRWGSAGAVQGAVLGLCRELYRAPPAQPQSTHKLIAGRCAGRCCPLLAGTGRGGPRGGGHQLWGRSCDREARGAHGVGLTRAIGLSGSAVCGREGGKAEVGTAVVVCSQKWGADGQWLSIWPF